MKPDNYRSKNLGWARFVPFISVSTLIVLLAFFTVDGFVNGWEPWTGFGQATYQQNQGELLRPARTLWDWMELLIVPIVLTIGAFLLQQTEKRISDQAIEGKSRVDREIAHERNQEEIFDNYLKTIFGTLGEISQGALSDALLNTRKQELQVRTLVTVRRLDSKRNKMLFRLLRDLKLVGLSGDQDYISFVDADLEGSNLEGVDLTELNFEGANLRAANLRHTILQSSNMQKVDLTDADLTGADLVSTQLQEAKLRRANLSRANLRNANLQKAKMRQAILVNADLKEADLNGANLVAAVLDNANLQETKLRGAFLGKTFGISDTGKEKFEPASLKNAIIDKTDFTGADLEGVMLDRAIVKDAKITKN